MRIDRQEVDPQDLSTEYQRLMESQRDRPEALRAPEPQLRQLAAENVINRELVLREARRRHPTVKMADVQRRAAEIGKRYGQPVDVSQFLVSLQDDVRVQTLTEQINRSVPRIAEAEARAEYDRDSGSWAEPEQAHVSHIVRHTFGDASASQSLKEILEAQQLLKAGQPFEAVARRFSDRHGQAGDLGTFARGAMVDKFENVVFRMKPGQLSDVFQTEFGYHIALVHERHPRRERSFDEAKRDVVRSLRDQREREAFDRFVADLRGAAVIERDDEPPAQGAAPPAS